MYVYFIRGAESGCIKIGSSTQPEWRRTTLQTGSAEHLEIIGTIETPRARYLEKELHARFAGDRLHAEWFDPTPALMEYVAENTRFSPTRDYVEQNRQALIDSASAKRRAAGLIR